MRILGINTIILSLLEVLLSQEASFNYDFTSNVNISSNNHQSKLIATFQSKQEKYSCLKECNKNPSCLSCSFDTSTSNCYLYNFTSSISDYNVANNAVVFRKQLGSLLTHFQSIVLKSSIYSSNGVNFSVVMSTEMVIDNGDIYYYAVDQSVNNVIKHDSAWMYLSNVAITKPRTIKWIKNALYVSANGGFYKLDYNLNILKSISDIGAIYNGIYYNSTDDTIITCLQNRYRIDILDLNLNLLGNISMGSYSPMGINSYNGSLFVSARKNEVVIYVIQNKQIINTILINPTNAYGIFTILIDDYGYMALTFREEQLVKLYHVNGSYTGLSINLPNFTVHINYDYSKNNLMISAHTGIYFY